MLTDEETKRRKPLWLAYSDLWFGGEKGEYEYTKIVDAMISSRYEIDRLEKICFEEVAPVMYKNLYYDDWYTVDEDWLYEKIVSQLKKQKINPVYQLWIESAVGRFLMTRTIQDDWKKIVELYRTKVAKTKNSKS